jgi:methylthioribose-1-phosphate isomerase
MAVEASPLFVPARWRGDHFEVLDETLLPERIHYLRVANERQALEVVGAMRTRAFGQVMTFCYAAALVARALRGGREASFRPSLDELAERFAARRPTFDFRGLAASLGNGLGDARDHETAILEYVERLIARRRERARRAAELLPRGCRLLTHCNLSGELVAIAEAAERAGNRISVIATETRPYLQGSRLTAWELRRAGVEVSLIPDGAVAQVLAAGAVDAVLVGSDRSAQNGDIVNKIGTYPLAVAARRYGVPFYVLVQPPGAAQSGEEIAIERRPAEELLVFRGRRLAPEGVAAEYPAFDVTPASYATGLIGFEGVRAPEACRELELRQRPPGPAAGERRPEGVLVHGVPGEEGYGRLREAARGLKLLVPELRPGLWGTAVAAELLRRGLSPVLISDNMMGYFFSRGSVERLILFSAGRAALPGSRLALLLARWHGVEAELREGPPLSGVRADRDVTTFLGEKVAPEGVAAYRLRAEAFAEIEAG